MSLLLQSFPDVDGLAHQCELVCKPTTGKLVECDAQSGTIQLLLALQLLIYGCKMLKETEYSPDPGTKQMNLFTWRDWQSVLTPGTQPALL